jgi:hypothetical protein
LLTTFISFFINAYYPGKLFGFGAKEQMKCLYPHIIISSIMFLSIYFIELESIEIQLLIKVAIGAVVYTGLCWMFKLPAFISIANILFNKFKK